MTATFFLVRHAAHDNLGAYLAGRTPGIRLGADGLAQADALATRMAREDFTRILASPVERTMQTANAIARARGIDVEPCDDLLEIDFGTWSGKDFETLNREPQWRQWNERRSLSITPAGERMLDVQLRVARCIDRLRQEKHARVVLVSHADVIRAAIALYLGLQLDNLDRFSIDPASVSCLEIGDWSARALYINDNHV